MRRPREAARSVLDWLIGLGVVACALVAASGGFAAGRLGVHDTGNGALAVIALLVARRLAEPRGALDTVPVVAWIARRLEALRDRLRPWAATLAAAAAAVYAGLVGAAAVRRHRVFESDAFDLGIFDQLVWRVAHGHELYSSVLERHFLGEHLSPVLYLLAPLYRIWASPEALLLLQTAALAAGAIPVYLLARDRLGSPNWGLAFAAAYLSYEPLRGLNLYDFHPVALAVPCLLAAWLAAERGRWGLLALAVGLALSAKEEVALAVAVFGLYLAVFRRRRLAGAVLAVVGTAVFLAAIFVVVPHFRGGPYVFVKRYPFLEAVLGEVPAPPGISFEAAAQGLRLEDRLHYLVEIFGPLAFLPLLGGAVLLVALPTLAQNLLSAFANQFSTASHYSAVLIPFVVVAAIEGMARLRRRPGLARRLGLLSPGAAPAPRLAAWLVVAAVLFVGRSPVVWLRQLEPPPSAAALAEAMAGIPPGASLSAQGSLVPHLAHRTEIYAFPTPQAADLVLLDSATDLWPLEPERYLAEARALLRRGYGVVWHRRTVVLLAREPEPGAKRNLPGRFIRELGLNLRQGRGGGRTEGERPRGRRRGRGPRSPG